MSNNQLLTGIPDPPYRNNVIKDQKGQESQPGTVFSALITQVWYAFFNAVVQWANTQGTTKTIAYNGADYSKESGVGAWTVQAGDLNNATYRLNGDSLTVNYRIVGSSVGAGGMLVGQIALPDIGIGTYILSEVVEVPACIKSAGVTQLGGTALSVGLGQAIWVFCDAAIPAGADNVDVSFSLTCGVQRQ